MAGAWDVDGSCDIRTRFGRFSRPPERQTESRAVVAELQRALVESACAPGDALDKAIQYTSKRWTK